MKKLFLLIIGFLLSNNMHSQSYTSLLLDSLHKCSWSIDFEQGDTIYLESWSAYFYDANDSLTQVRNPKFRSNYIYGTDATSMTTEMRDTNGVWNLSNRATNTFNNGKILSTLQELYSNDSWVNASLRTYSYEGNAQYTTLLNQHWSNGMWVDFQKLENTYDDQGNKIEHTVYYAFNGKDLEYNWGVLYTYNELNQLIEEISINNSVNGLYYTSNTTRSYNSNGLIDTLTRCRYAFPNDGTCNDESMTTYSYADPQTTILNSFRWSDDKWDQTKKELTYAGPAIYSDRPDSIITYDYFPDSLKFVPTRRQYFQYEELDNDTVYFKNEEYRYFTPANQWRLVNLQEEWYHAKELVHNDEWPSTKALLSIYPNPCEPGQLLNLPTDIPIDQNLDILVYHQNGQLVSRTNLKSLSPLKAPEEPGIYTIVFQQNGRLMGTSKQIVIE